jgi:hypothetical protein
MGWIILLGLCGGAMIPGISRGIGELHKRRRAKQRMDAASLSLGDHSVVTVRGRVRLLGKSLNAPLSGSPCVAHCSRARIYSQRSRGRIGVRQAIDDEVLREMVPFVLSTRDGDLMVDGTIAEIAIRPSPVIPRRLDREIEFLRALGFEADPANAGFDEVLITEGMKITVHGVARIEVSAETSDEVHYRDAPKRMRLTGDESHPLTISDA